MEEQVRSLLVEMEAYPKIVKVTLSRGEEVEIQNISVTVRPICSQEKREEASNELERIYELPEERIRIFTG